MRIIAKLYASSLAIFIAGCSGAPDTGDIEDNLVNLLACPAISVENVIKTNGIDQGSFYSVSYTYKMVFPKGAENSDELQEVLKDCSPSTIILLGNKILGRGAGIGFPIEDGKEVEVSGNAVMVKSENGWIFQ